MKLLKWLAVLILLCMSAGMSAPLAEGAAKFVGNITTNGQVRSDFGQYWNQNCDAYPDDPMCKTVWIDFNKADAELLNFDVYDPSGKYHGALQGMTATDAVRYSKLSPGIYLMKVNGSWKTVIK